MRLHSLQHVTFEGLGSIEQWASERDYEVTTTRLFAGEPLPPMEEVDLLVVLGGPMGVYDEEKFPWLRTEKRYLFDALRMGVKMLGVCLGAQLIADVLDAQVGPNLEREIGWFPIETLSAAADNPFGRILSRAGDVFHWHGDKFSIPHGAVHLARSNACENQAFSLGDQVLALQFHLETTRASVDELVRNCGSEIVNTRYVQPAHQLQAEAANFERINKLMAECLDQLTGHGQIAAGQGGV
ncbi:MAG: type 1 glutamine amidotransferase [Bdellovibrionota bacterium]